jgi:hypothetical protein
MLNARILYDLAIARQRDLIKSAEKANRARIARESRYQVTPRSDHPRRIGEKALASPSSRSTRTDPA